MRNFGDQSKTKIIKIIHWVLDRTVPDKKMFEQKCPFPPDERKYVSVSIDSGIKGTLT